MSCQCAAASRNYVRACVARMLLLPTAPRSVATCQYRLLQRATPPGLRRSSPSPSAAAAFRVLLVARQALSIRLRGEHRSGSRLKRVAAPPKLALALQFP